MLYEGAKKISSQTDLARFWHWKWSSISSSGIDFSGETWNRFDHEEVKREV